MPNSIQESIFKAIDSLVNDRLNKFAIDQTIVCNIVQCKNALNNEYIVNYQGGNMTAYAEDGTAYGKNTSVYVLVPEGNFNKKKIIVGKASAIGDDNNITFVSSMINDYNTLGKNVIVQKDETESFGLHSYLHEDYALLYDYDAEDPATNRLNVNIEEFQNYLKTAEAVMIEASFLTRLPTEHRNTKTGIYGLQFVLAFQDRSTSEPTYKTLSYVIDTNSMTGNPYAYSSWSDQYAIFPIDRENFSHIQSIMFYSQGFEEEDDLVKDRLYGADIFCKNIEFYGLKKITAIYGDYRLRLSTPQGATFKTSNPDDSLQVLADVRYQNLPSDGWMFYWFKSDARVTTSSSLYHAYGGTGWASLKETKGTLDHIVVLEKENKAYENQYLCVAVYKEQIILKEEFTIYNDTARRSLGIVSNLGIKFSFDRGTPILTCLIDGKSENFDADNATKRPDSWFTFLWSKIDNYGQVFTFEKTYDQLLEEYNQALKDKTDYTILLSLKNVLQQVQGVTFNKNVFQYPIKGIDSSATFRCSVYVKDTENGESYYIGSADITLQNEGAATPNDYFILIENGDQVFQYSESGVAPNNERLADPQEIFPLYCHFYDPAGLEVDNNTYQVTWQVPYPSKDTMIELPSQLSVNPANDQQELFLEKIYPMDIVENFDYQALNNQITCIVDYQGQQYTKDTRFSFVKVGDNGTNGTDIVVKISPISEDPILDKDLLTLIIADNYLEWNTGQTISEKVLDLDVYQRDQKLITENAKWTIASKKSSALMIETGDETGVVLRLPTAEEAQRATRCQIVKAQTTINATIQTGELTDDLTEVQENLAANRTTYFATYAIPIIKSYKGLDYPLHIDNKYTLKQIIYNADGRNPLYNKNQGVKIRYSGEGAEKKQILLSALGGQNENAATTGNTAAFKLMVNRDDYRDGSAATTLNRTFDENGECLTYILPEDVYTGLYTNNVVYGQIKEGNNIEAEFWIPLHMQLNTVELASLNAWDGNHIEINDDENYILAPQIGAGVKDEQNRFTGLVMGKSQRYDEREPMIGLLGYSGGRQSIWMDAETGNTILGVSDKELTADNPEGEGRIELIPGGISSIANWKIDRHALYNVVDGAIGRPYTGGGYSKAPDGANRSVPHDKQGILLNAEPTYASFKGRLITVADFKGNERNVNRVVDTGDALELQIDPNDLSILTIYRHYLFKGTWHRDPLVGIDALGRFYANSLKAPVGSETDTTLQITTAFTLGNIGAFGVTAASKAYIGGYIDINTNSILKMFTDAATATSSTSPIYLSGSADQDNEYRRPMKLYGDSVEIYAKPAEGPTLKTSDAFIKLNKDMVGLQVSPPNSTNKLNNRLIIRPRATEISEFQVGSLNTLMFQNETTRVEGTTTKTHVGNYTLNVGDPSKGNQANATYNVTGLLNETVNRAVTNTYKDNQTVNISKEYSLTTGEGQGFTVRTTSSTGTGNMRLGTVAATDYIQLEKGNGSRSTFTVHGGLNILSNGGTGSTGAGIHMIAGAAAPVKISSYNSASGEVYLSLMAQSGQGGDWVLSAPTRGSINSGNFSVGGFGDLNMVRATPGFSSPFIVGDGVVAGSDYSIIAGHSLLVNNGIRVQGIVEGTMGLVVTNHIQASGYYGKDINLSDYDVGNVAVWIANHKTAFQELQNLVSTVQQTANTALQTANTALQTANSALTTAQGKSSVGHTHSVSFAGHSPIKGVVHDGDSAVTNYTNFTYNVTTGGSSS